MNFVFFILSYKIIVFLIITNSSLNVETKREDIAQSSVYYFSQISKFVKILYIKDPLNQTEWTEDIMDRVCKRQSNRGTEAIMT